MKKNRFEISPKIFLTRLTLGLTAVGLLLSNASQAQPGIQNIQLPNAPNTADGYTPGTLLFDGAVPPSANQFSFQVSSGTGVTSLTVQLTATTLPGVVTTTLLTPTFGLSVSGGSMNETATTTLEPDMLYTAVITAADAGGSTPSTVTFDTINPNYFTFEAEDFDYGGGQFFDSLPAGSFPQLDAYYDLAAVVGIDCNNHSGGQDVYRPNPLETEGENDTPRFQYDISGYPDYDVGFNNGGDWGNYTRTYPAGVYNIYLRGSGGSGPQANSSAIGLVTGGWGTTSQTTKSMGQFSIAGLGWQTYTWCPAIDANGNLVAWGAGGDQETLRFTVDNGNGNQNFYLLVPAVPVITPNSTNVYQGNPATLSIAPYALNTPTVVWQSDNGSGGVNWSNIDGATSTDYAVPTGSLLAQQYQYRVVLTVLSSGAPVNVTSAPITLNILAPTKPVVVQDTYPASATAPVGSATSFSASFSGTLPISYQWLVSSNLGSTFTALTGQTNTTLVVLDLSLFTNEYELEATNSAGSSTSTAATLTTTPAVPTPPLQLSGDMVAELRSSDLAIGASTWTNRSGSAATVGNFQQLSKGVLTVQNNTADPGAPLYGAYSVNALYVNSLNTALQSAQLAPTEICGNGASSGEAWIYATTIPTSDNNTVIAYGVQGQAVAPEEDREMNWGPNSGCFSGDFGSLDCGWPSPYPQAGAWEYVVWTYDGTNAMGYVDGVQEVDHTLSPSTTFSGYPIETVQSVVGVGAALFTSPNDIQVDNFSGGWIASVRLSSGVLTPTQISNNYAAGLLAVAPVTVSEPGISPSNTTITMGNSATLSAEVSNAQYPFTYQWQWDSGSGGTSWTPISGATNATYDLNTTGLAAGTYEYELVLSNSTYSITAVSSPIIITVTLQTKPILTQDVTPTSINAYVTQTNVLTAVFTGETPLTTQWQVSSDDVNWTGTGVSTTNIVVTSEVPLTNWYRFIASNPLGTNASSAAEVIILPALPLPAYTPLQTAGDLIVNLQAVDLSSAYNTWTNVTSDTNSVGNFSGALIGGGNLSVAEGAPYLYNRVNALFVNQVLANGVQSALLAPTEIVNNSPVSAEAWIFADAVNEQNSCAIGYGVQGGSEDPEADREFNYCHQGSGAVSGDFGNYDTAWATTPAPGAWHYLAWTYDGTTVSCYLDGVLNVQNSPNPLETPSTVICVGGSLANRGPNLSADAFQGYIGAARVESGVLSSAQIANNYTAGLFGAVPIVLWAPSVTSVAAGNVYNQGETVTLGLVDRESTAFTYQWYSDHGTGGASWFPATGSSTGTNYVLNTGSLAVGTYEYEIVASSSAYSLSQTSPVVTLTIIAGSEPMISQQPTPASAAKYVGQSVSYSAAFSGNQPMVYQWKYSPTGSSYTSINGATNTTLNLSNLQVNNTGSYTLTASNSLGGPISSAAATLTVTQVPAAGITYNSSAGKVTLTYPAGGTLLQSASVTGPWTVVPGATSPYLITPTPGSSPVFYILSFGP